MNDQSRTPNAAAAPTTTSRTLINQVADWLMDLSLAETDIETIVMGCCERLYAAGLPITRGYFAFAVLHPLHNSIGITWTRGHGVTVQGYLHVPGGVSETFRSSPHYYMMEKELDFLRVRLECRDKTYDFPVLNELSDDGVTDYLAYIVNFDGKKSQGMLGSWATDTGAGFSDSDLDALFRIQRRLAVACKLSIRNQLLINLAETYLGRDAGAHVLSGQIKRGDGQSIRAVIWYSDLRGSTAMADNYPPEDYIEALNSYFDATGGSVINAGGEILSFVGDGLLAIFPTEGTPEGTQEACCRALTAADKAMQAIDETNQARARDGKIELNFGTALHHGEVMYGNVGVPQRLTFSAFGSAINEVVRLEQLTKTLNEPLLLSDCFVNGLNSESRPLGEHPLRGVGRRMVVHAPAQELCGTRDASGQ